MWPFNKKGDDMDLPTLGGSQESSPLPSSDFDMGGLPSTPALESSGRMENSELKVISAKLDTITAKLENLSQRLANIEKIASESQEAQPKQWYKV